MINGVLNKTLLKIIKIKRSLKNLKKKIDLIYYCTLIVKGGVSIGG